MAFSTYAELIAELESFSTRTDLAAKIPSFIALAESVMRRELATMREEKRAYATTVPGDDSIALPTDYEGMRELFIDSASKTTLEQVSLNKLRRSYGATATGVPVIYAISDNEIFLAPTPDSAYRLVMGYYGFRSLSEENTSNGILINYPDTYLYLSLSFLFNYLKDSQKEAEALARGMAAVESANDHDKWLRFGRYPLRSMPSQVV